MILPKVSIVIQTWEPKNKMYLDACMRSIMNLDYPKDKLEIIITCPKHFQPRYPTLETEVLIKYVTPDKDWYSSVEGANFGVQHMAPDSEYIQFANDDVVFTKKSLSHMIDVARTTGQIVHPISPCDNYASYHLIFLIQKPNGEKQIEKRFHRFDEMKDDIDDMMNSGSIYNYGLIPQPYLCMFATLVPKSVWNAVGEFDENFKTGQDDIDYSFRAAQKGYHMFVALHALVWHFGGATADTSTSLKQRKENILYFKNKWGQFPPGMSQEFFDQMDEGYKQGS